MTGDWTVNWTGIRAVILDWDGTVADTQGTNYAALTTVLRHYGMTVDRDWYQRHLGLAIHDLLAVIPGDHPPLPAEEIISACRRHLLTTIDRLRPVPAVLALLHDATARGLPCGIASGAAAVLVNTGLRALDLTHLFTTIVTREDVQRGKPAPDLYLHAARRLNVAPPDCLAVDDAPDGIAAAHAAGMRVLTVHHGQLTPAPTGSDQTRP